MRLINVETFKLEEFLGSTMPSYAILSHTWGNDNEEVSFRNIEEGKIEKAGIQPIKLAGCCAQAKKDGLRYAWIDTCCIDKANSVELGEAINSMFKWYSNASICYTYLSDVPIEDNPRNPSSKFFSSRWFQRGWTLQELLAPKNLRFYNSEWCYLGTRIELSVMIEKITGIPRPFLLGIVELREASIAQRMSWAAKRVTKRKEDIAYCLLGIFGVTMAMIYGEGDEAFSRLQQEIMREARDDSILAWGLNLTNSTTSNSTKVMSGGVLAAAPSDFISCGRIVSREQYSTPINSFDFFGGSLRIHLPLFTTSAGETYGLLRCGPGHDTEQVVGIPLDMSMPRGLSDEYIRPHGRYSVLFPKVTPAVSAKFIHIQKKPQSRGLATMNRRYWFYIEEFTETNLELIDVEPRTRWQKDNSMITTTTESDANITQRTLTRFRHKEEGSYDFVIVLEFEVRRSQMQARCHVMISSRDTTLKNVAQRFIYMRQDALRKHSASNGILNLHVTLREESVAGQLMFVIRLAVMQSLPQVTIDATLELRQLDLKLELVSALQEEDKIRLEGIELGQQIKEKVANLGLMEGELEAIEEKLRKLGDERRLLVDGLEKGSQEIDRLTIRATEIEQRQDEQSERRLQTQQRLDDLLDNEFVTKELPEYGYEAIIKQQLATRVDSDSIANDGGTPLSWAAKNGYEAVVRLLLATGKVDADLKDNAGGAPLLYAAMNGHDAVVRQLLEAGAAVGSKDTSGLTPLSWAAMNGHEAVTQLLLERGAELESQDTDGQTPLSWAAANGRKAVVKLLLEKDAELESKDAYDHTPLLFAALNGHEAVVKLLLEAGAELELEDTDGRTPLSWAVENGHEAIVKLLLEQGAEPESKDTNGWTPLSWAVGNGHEAVVKLLLERGAMLESKDNDGLTPLSRAAENGHEAMVKLLLEQGAELESKDTNGQTPLSLAAKNGYEVMAKILLEKGAKLETKDTQYGWTPLSWAIENGHEAIVKLLVKQGAKLESKDTNGLTPLLWAVENGYEAMAKLLLEQGAELELEDTDGRTPLSWAVGSGNEAMVKLLVEQGAKLESKDTNGLTPLLWAVEDGYKAIAKLLLEKGAKLETKDTQYGRTPLSWAVGNGNEAMVKLLVEQGAQLESKDTDGQTPLLLAARRGHEATVKLLLEQGAELESKDTQYSQTPLSWAAEKGHEAVVKLLLEQGAELESKESSYDRTPLSLAAESGHEAVVKLLLKQGAELESRGADGRTPLWLAVENGHETMVKLLLEEGAVLETEDTEYSRTPLLLAARSGHEAMVKLLLKQGAKLESKDTYGQTPLSWAAENGHEAILKLLLEQGAQLESEGIWGQTPLSLATERGHEVVAKLLQERGAKK